MAAKKKTVATNKKGKFTALKTSNIQEYAIVKCEDNVEESQEEDDVMLGDENYPSSKRNDKLKPKPPQQASKEIGPSAEDQQRYSREETERRLEENEQFIIELLSRTQPHHDHSYTTVFGKKKSFYNIEMISASDDEVETNEDYDDETLKFYCGREIIRPKRIAEPILCLGNVSVMDELSGYGHDEASKTIIVCAEEIVGDHIESPSLEDPIAFKGHSGQSMYLIERKNRLFN